MSLPKTAAVRVNWVPGQLHPVAGVAGEADRDALELLDVRTELRRPGGRHPPSGCLHPLVRPRRQVEQLLGERLGQVLDDVRLADDPDEPARRRRRAGRSDSGRSASARWRRGSCRRDRASGDRVVISDSTGWSRSTRPPTIWPKMSRSVRTPISRPIRRRTRTPNRRCRCAGSRGGIRPAGSRAGPSRVVGGSGRAAAPRSARERGARRRASVMSLTD